MKWYKGWSPEVRQKNLRLYNKALKLAVIKKPCKCDFCGQDKGILQRHCEDYDISLRVLPRMIAGTATLEEQQELRKVLWEICWRCHMIFHSKARNPAAHKLYFHQVQVEKRQFPPVYKHDFTILNREHGF